MPMHAPPTHTRQILHTHMTNAHAPQWSDPYTDEALMEGFLKAVELTGALAWTQAASFRRAWSMCPSTGCASAAHHPALPSTHPCLTP